MRCLVQALRPHVKPEFPAGRSGRGRHTAIFVGGITRTEEAESVHRVPVLGYIPILSLILSKSDTQNVQTELIALITPTLLTDGKSADDVTKQQRERLNELERWMRERHGGHDATEEE